MEDPLEIKLSGCPQAASYNPVASATSLVESLRLRGSETDTLARLPDSTVADLEERRLFSLLVPKIYGGMQCSMEVLMDTVSELGRGDGSAAWVVALLSSTTWMAATIYPKQVVDEIFSGGTFRTAGELSPHNVRVKRLNDGVLIEEGFWAFNSGVHHAHWEILGIPISDAVGTIVDRGAALIPRSEVTIRNDWDTIGLRGSGSNTVTAKDVFVPNERIALLSRMLREDYASGHLRNEPLYRMPLLPLLSTNLVFPILGMAKAAFELIVEGAPHRGISYTQYGKQVNAAVTHLQVGEAATKIDAAEALLKRSVREVEAVAATCDVSMTREQRARIWRDAGAASQMLWEAVDLLARMSGSSFARVGNPMNRLWRDVRVAGLHGALRTSTTAEIFGRIIFGKNPNTPFL